MACFICAKRTRLADLPGREIAGDAHALVTHLPLETPQGIAPDVYLGYLFVEPRRHVAELGDLNRAEAASVGELAAAAAGGLHRAVSADHVYAAVIGHGIDHLHVHLIARYPGTPREFWWTRVDEWPEAPRGDARAVAELATRIRAAMALERPAG